jgi:hypothetical protein
MTKTEEKFVAKWPNGRFILEFGWDGDKRDPSVRALHCVLEPCRGRLVPNSISVCNYDFANPGERVSQGFDRPRIPKIEGPGVFPYYFSTDSAFIQRPYTTLDKLIAAARRKNTCEGLIEEFVKQYNKKKPYFRNAYSHNMNERM